MLTCTDVDAAREALGYSTSRVMRLRLLAGLRLLYLSSVAATVEATVEATLTTLDCCGTAYSRVLRHGMPASWAVLSRRVLTPQAFLPLLYSLLYMLL